MKSVIYVAVAVLAGVTGFGIYRYAIEPRAAAEAELQTATRPEAGRSGVPDTLPDFTLADEAGNPRSILSWPDKSMIVNVWATWCAPCRREIPLLKELQHTHGPDGFQVVGVAVDVREDVLKFAEEIAIDYPLIMGEQDALEAVSKFNLGLGFPFTVFTDSQHRIVLTHLGELHKPQADVILPIIARVNRGELTRAAARAMAATQLEQLDLP